MTVKSSFGRRLLTSKLVIGLTLTFDMDPDACRQFDDPNSELNYSTQRTISDHCTHPTDLGYPWDDQDIDHTDHTPYLRGRAPLETHIPDR